MSEYISHTVDGDACTDWPAIHRDAAKYPRSLIRVERYDEKKLISEKQTAYLHAVVFPTLAREMHCSLWYAAFWCKKECGEQWELIKQVGPEMWVERTKTVLTTKQCNEWIESIYDKAEMAGIHIPPPNKDWRTRSPAERTQQ